MIVEKDYNRIRVLETAETKRKFSIIIDVSDEYAYDSRMPCFIEYLENDNNICSVVGNIKKVVNKFLKTNSIDDRAVYDRYNFTLPNEWADFAIIVTMYVHIADLDNFLKLKNSTIYNDIMSKEASFHLSVPLNELW